MILLSNTVLFYDQVRVSYEILQTKDMLLFKPYFYHTHEDFPCIILTKKESGWQFQSQVDKILKDQVLEDIENLNV
ncbi:MAG TPA: hypothetical protein VNS32_16035 [Flavisolibacter sp.]|nr:hypothetical protein [Flavisolibacter sp.]